MAGPAVTGQGGLSDLLARRGYRDLLAGQTVSGLGDWMAMVALMALVLDITGSSTAVGAVLVLRLTPTVLAGPLATRLVARWDARRTMMAMDAARAGVVVLIPLVGAIWWVYLWAFLLEVGGLVFLPARDAAIPRLTGDGDLSLANGLVLGSSYGTIPLGAGVFGVVAALSGSHPGAGSPGMVAVFVFDAVTFLVSMALVARLGELKGFSAAHPAAGGAEEEPAGFFDAFRLPLVRAIAPAATVAALGIGALFSLGIVFVRNVLGASNLEFGVLVALFGVGAAAGLGVLHLGGLRGVTVVGAAVAVQGAVIAGMSLAPDVALTFLGAVGFGAATAVALTAAMDVLQERIAEDERVAAFAAFHVLIRGGLALAAIAAGAAADVLHTVHLPGLGRLPGVRAVLLLSGLTVVVGAALVVHSARGLRDA
jgi:dTMP kinase